MNPIFLQIPGKPFSLAIHRDAAGGETVSFPNFSGYSLPQSV